PQARARLVDALSILDHRNADLLPPLDLDERVGVRDDDNTRGDRADRRAAPSVRKIDTVMGPLLLLSPPLQIAVRDVVAVGLTLVALREVELIADRIDERPRDRNRRVGGRRK